MYENNGNRKRVQPFRLDSGAHGFESVGGNVPEIALSHLAPG